MFKETFLVFLNIVCQSYCIVTLFFYCFRPPSQHDEVNRRRRRTNALLACMTIVFFVCWAPMVIFCFIYDFANHLIPQRGSLAQFTYALNLLFGMLTPIANPILYSLLNESFRDVAKQKYSFFAFLSHKGLCCD